MSTNILLVIFVWFVVPETKKISLEEIDMLFGGANHIEKGSDFLNVDDPHHPHIELDDVVGKSKRDTTHVEQVAQEIHEN
jgi:hypothetical protein